MLRVEEIILSRKVDTNWLSNIKWSSLKSYMQITLYKPSRVYLEYMYAFLTRKEDTAYMVLRVEDNEKAADILSKSGIHTICQDAVANL